MTVRRAILAALIAISLSEPAIGSQRPLRDDRPPTGLSAVRLYNGIGRPVVVHVNPARDPGVLNLVLLSEDGAVLDGPVAVRPGRTDLAKRLPAIWSLRKTAYVQMIVRDEPMDAALVLQPMLTRMVPVVEEALNPNGIRYTKIVGWRSEMESSEPAEHDAPERPSQDTDAKEIDPDAAEPKRLITGLRLYSERDVVMHTSLGEVRIAMRPDHAPNTVWNFLHLCENGFYRDVVFHRIVPLDRDGVPFVIQAGDPTADGSGGPGYWLPIEPSELPHDFGVISMARDAPPDSAGSQFFICLSRRGTARLDGHYCSFGYAVEGAETINQIASTPLADVGAGRPADPPVIQMMRLVPSPPRAPQQGRPDLPLFEQPIADADKPSRVRR